jgi:dynein intermediate chain 2
MLGTEQGIIVALSRRKNKGYQIDRPYFAHYGPVYSVQRNPFLSKYFLSIGDWTAKIWVDDLASPIITTKYHNSYLTNGCWSISRPGVFFTTKMDGTLDVWDFLYKQNKPLLSVSVSNSSLHSMRMYNGRCLAVGGVDGTTSLIELSDGLSGFKNDERLSSNEEKNAVQEMFERELKREKLLEEQKREISQQKKKMTDNANPNNKNKSSTSSSSSGSSYDLFTVDDKQLTDIEEYFYGELK